MSGPDPSRGASHVDWLFALQRFGMEPGLDDMRALLRGIGDPAAGTRTALVAGTNGKGSVSSVLATALAAGGQRVGLYTSPHLQRLGERVVIDGMETPLEALEILIGKVRPVAEQVGSTFFEVMTAVALLAFAEAGVDVAVLEVGLGGRLDATNVVEPELSVITSIGLDHTAILGGTLEKVALEKAGILRKGVPLVSGVEPGEAWSAIARRAQELGAPVRRYGVEFRSEPLRIDWQGSEFVWRRASANPAELLVATPLVGRHQVRNVTLALEAAATMGVDPRTAAAAAAGARWPGRLELFEWQGRRVVLDGAHNPDAARALAAAVRELGGASVLVFGASDDKDVAGVLHELDSMTPMTVLTRARLSPRAMTPTELLKRYDSVHPAEPTLRVSVAATPTSALEQAVAASGPGEVIVVAGSLFLVGEVRDLLTGSAVEEHRRWQ